MPDRDLTDKQRRPLRRPNAPYFQLDVLGRLIVNAYRTGQHRHDGPNPVVQRIDESGTFEWSRGFLIHIGRVGVFVALRGNGPGFGGRRG